MVMLAEQYEYVIGDDPDRDTIDLAVIDERDRRTGARRMTVSTPCELVEQRWLVITRPRHTLAGCARRCGRSWSLDRRFWLAAINELKSLIVVAPKLRADLRGVSLLKQLERIAALASSTQATVEHRVTVMTLQSIAARIQFLSTQVGEFEPELKKLLHAHPAGPALLAEPGVGPVVAAQLLVSWSHHGRVRSEAAFASLAGVASIEASSGQRCRHRLTAVATVTSTGHCTRSRSPDCVATQSPGPTRSSASLKARPTVTYDARSNAHSLDISTAASKPPPPRPRRPMSEHRKRLDNRSVQ